MRSHVRMYKPYWMVYQGQVGSDEGSTTLTNIGPLINLVYKEQLPYLRTYIKTGYLKDWQWSTGMIAVGLTIVTFIKAYRLFFCVIYWDA